MTPQDGVAVRSMRPQPRIRTWFITRLILVIFTLVAAYAGWGGWMQHRLNAHLAALRAAGELIYATDFDVPTPPPGENAADVLIAAAAIIRASAEMKPFDRWNYWVSLPLTD